MRIKGGRMSDIAIGIDLGTSNSCVAITENENTRVLQNDRGESIIPSVVHFQEDGTIVVGSTAKLNIIADPENTVYSAKRLLGRYYFSDEVKKAKAVYSYAIEEGPDHSVRIKLRDETLSLPEVSAMVLKEMKQIAEARLEMPATKAVITVPAFFNDNQRQATRDAGQIAGLEVLRILNEPTAAALAYGFGKQLNQRVAVYDLGGGTFDISILEISNDVFEVLATAGDTYLGGDDFDDRLIDLFADKFFAEHQINLRHERKAYEQIKLCAEDVKKKLSTNEQVSYSIPDLVHDAEGNPICIEGTVTGEEFSALVMDLVLRTFKVCDEAMQRANLVTRDLDGVILVGGPTRLPVVRNHVREYFQQEPRADIDPDQVVAIGAAIHAESLNSAVHETHLLDVTPLSLRIGVAGGLAETIIETNTPIPIEQTRSFTTFEDYQKTVNLRVYQGESRKAQDNEMLGEFVFSGFETGRRGEVRIDVTFAINTDGIVEVTALDPTTGVKARTALQLSSGLSKKEIEEILEKDRTKDVLTQTQIGMIQLVQVPYHAVVGNEEPLDLAMPTVPEADEIVLLEEEPNPMKLVGNNELEYNTESQEELELELETESDLETDFDELLVLEESRDLLFGEAGVDLTTDDDEEKAE